MSLLAAARRSSIAMAARRSSFAAPGALPISTRNFAAKVTSPRPLSIRGDGLMIQCVVAALVYFVPQDAVFLGGLFWTWHNYGAKAAPKQKQADAEAALEEFKAKKGLEDVKISKGRSTWYVRV
eukprot:TRINITY_DN11429_c0_g1_i2.p1 TRINITY_DN11429_c0_g1~~TRINITY_DN11429_c0_g1_i2.p1  ORF type:complete len:144 (+),score=36.69 TRINITY_DN11429_c0_g1_i2:61-432(+)